MAGPNLREWERRYVQVTDKQHWAQSCSKANMSLDQPQRRILTYRRTCNICARWFLLILGVLVQQRRIWKGFFGKQILCMIKSVENMNKMDKI